MGADIEWVDVSDEDAAAALRYALVIEWSPRDEAFVVTVPDIPGLHTHGATREEAATMGNDAVALWIAGARKTGVAPPPPRFGMLETFDVPVSDARSIRQIRRRLDLSQRDFAELLNVSLGTVRSWEQGLRTPDGAARRLLQIAERQPEALLEMAADRPRRSPLSA